MRHEGPPSPEEQIVPRIVVATHHEAEFAELATALAALGWEAVRPNEAGLGGVRYNNLGANQREQAINRAKAFSAASPLPVLAQATALQAYALDQGPGVRTHDYAGPGASDAEHRAKLLVAMKRVATGQRIALFQSTVALAIPGEEKVRATSSTLECEVTTEERGEGGFLYNAVTQLQNRKTLAELDDDERTRLSHRGMAMKQMARHLNELLAQAEAAS